MYLYAHLYGESYLYLYINIYLRIWKNKLIIQFLQKRLIISSQSEKPRKCLDYSFYKKILQTHEIIQIYEQIIANFQSHLREET